MRVTQNTNFQTVRDTLHRSKSRMEDLQLQGASLKKINAPSDDPVSAAKLMEVRTDSMINEQFYNTAKLAQAYLNHSEHVISEITDVMVRAKEIALSQSSDASSTDASRVGVAEEVEQLFKSAVASANTKIGDRYLFGGYQTNKPPVNDDGHYTGDDGEMMVEIAKDVYLAMNVPGIEVFNTDPQASFDGERLWGPAEEREERAIANSPEYQEGDTPPTRLVNKNVFNELKNLRIALLTGDVEGVRGTIDSFDQLTGRLVALRSQLGSRMSGLESNINSLERHDVTSAKLVSGLVDADMNEVMSNLAKEEIVFRNVLSSAQRLTQPTLMDFLR